MKRIKLWGSIKRLWLLPSLISVFLFILLLLVSVPLREKGEQISQTEKILPDNKAFVSESRPTGAYEYQHQFLKTEGDPEYPDDSEKDNRVTIPKETPKQSLEWRVNELVNRAVREYGEGNLPKAEAALNEALYLDSHNSLILAMLIQINREQGHDSILIDLYQRLLVAEPENSQAYTALGMLLDEQGRGKEAEEYFLEAESLGTEEPYPYFYLARRAPSSDAVISRLHSAIGKAIRKMAVIQMQAAGTIQQKQGNLESEDLKQLKELSALSVQPRLILQESIVLLKKCYPDVYDYEQDLRRLADWYPNNLELCNALGSLLEEQLRFEEARDYWYSMINNHSTAPEIHMGLARSLNGLGQPYHAMTAYRRARDLAPENSEIYRALNRLYIADGQEEALLQWYGEIYERERVNISLLYGWADLEEKAGLLEMAMKHRLRAEELKQRE